MEVRFRSVLQASYTANPLARWHHAISWMDTPTLRCSSIPSDPRFPFPQVRVLAIYANT